MESLIIVVHVLAAIGITGLVLIQHGKGADMGASFGSGASQTIFGSVGSGNVLTKSTSWLATVFFITSLTLALFARQQAGQSIQNDSLIENEDQLEQLSAPPATQDVPAAPAEAGATGDIPQEAIDSLLQQVQPAADEAAAEEAATAETAAEEAPAAADETAETQVENAVEEPQNTPAN